MTTLPICLCMLIPMPLSLRPDCRIIDGIEDVARRAVEDRNEYLELRLRLSTLPAGELSTLMAGNNDLLSVTAAWVYYVERARPDSGQGIGCRQFLAFCRGRLHIEFPDWYGEILDSCAKDPQATAFWQFKKPVQPSGKEIYLPLEDGVLVPADIHARATIREGRIRIDLEGGRLEIEGASLRGFLRPLTGITFAYVGNEVWLGVFVNLAMSRGLTLRHLEYGVQSWEQSVWCVFDRSGSSGSSYQFHYPCVVRRDGIVYVMGVGNRGAYIEGFDSESGKPLVRFLSSVSR